MCRRSTITCARALKFGERKTYKPEIDVEKNWDILHQPPGRRAKVPGPDNVMPDLAVAMKQNPNLKVQLNGGYYDLATPYFAAMYELRQLPIEAALQDNIEMHFYTSGHMVYAHEPDLKALHGNVAAFIEQDQKRHGGAVAVTDLKSAIADVADFPRPGILFRDISPLLRDHFADDGTGARCAIDGCGMEYRRRAGRDRIARDSFWARRWRCNAARDSFWCESRASCRHRWSTWRMTSNTARACWKCSAATGACC